MKTVKYLKGSFSKFKQDLLSKAFYDVIKYLSVAFILVIISKFIPIIKEKLELEVSIKIWILLICSLILIGICLTISFLLFNRRLNKIRAESQIDDLTGLKNYKALALDLNNLQANWTSKDEPISLMLFDVDNFKIFNDENTYETADKILAKLGNLFLKDSRITDETYRYFLRGDEFLIIAKQTTIFNAKIAAERKRKLIEETLFDIDGKSFRLTVSCGLTEFNHGEIESKVLERANKALLSAKKNPNKNFTEIIV